MTELASVNQHLFAAIKSIGVQARKVACRSTNILLLNMCWKIGKKSDWQIQQRHNK
jgi:hypothetical protein